MEFPHELCQRRIKEKYKDLVDRGKDHIWMMECNRDYCDDSEDGKW